MTFIALISFIKFLFRNYVLLAWTLSPDDSGQESDSNGERQMFAVEKNTGDERERGATGQEQHHV